MRGERSTAPKTVEEYLANVPGDMRAALQRLRKTIREAAPDAEEVISYQIPAYRQHGMLVYFAAFKDHGSFFVGTEARRRFAAQLKSFPGGKGTVHFTPQRPLPSTLVKRIVKARVAENKARAAAKRRTVPRRATKKR